MRVRLKHIRLLFFPFSLLLVGLILVVTMSVAPAHAQQRLFPGRNDDPVPLCVKNACNGQDPYTQMCAGQSFDSARIVVSAPIQDRGGQGNFGNVELWWSDTCQTNWVVMHTTVASNTGIVPLLYGKGAMLGLELCQSVVRIVERRLPPDSATGIVACSTCRLRLPVASDLSIPVKFPLTLLTREEKPMLALRASTNASFTANEQGLAVMSLNFLASACKPNTPCSVCVWGDRRNGC